ncbi:MOSC domain-containing protein [Paenibacillus sp. D51F]
MKTEHAAGYLISIQTGRPQRLDLKGRSVLSAINKTPRSGAVTVRFRQVDGDSQAEPSVHGGPDKAVLMFSADRYPYWENKLGIESRPGLFGENLTVAGLHEEFVCIGDKLRIGAALLEVTEPRQPCYKLGVWLNQPKLPLWVKETGYGGYYLRVLEEGAVEAGNAVELQRHPLQVTVKEAFDVFYDRSSNWSAKAERVLAVEALGSDWRQALRKRFEKGAVVLPVELPEQA